MAGVCQRKIRYATIKNLWAHGVFVHAGALGIVAPAPLAHVTVLFHAGEHAGQHFRLDANVRVDHVRQYG
jgi:hypothetical protein